MKDRYRKHIKGSLSSTVDRLPIKNPVVEVTSSSSSNKEASAANRGHLSPSKKTKRIKATELSDSENLEESYYFNDSADHERTERRKPVNRIESDDDLEEDKVLNDDKVEEENIEEENVDEEIVMNSDEIEEENILNTSYSSSEQELLETAAQTSKGARGEMIQQQGGLSADNLHFPGIV
jgi:hypothetical protein